MYVYKRIRIHIRILIRLYTYVTTSYYHHLHQPSSIKIQNADILVSANPGLPRKWLLNGDREGELGCIPEGFQRTFRGC